MKASIGIDLDNTIICYDQAFYEAALARNLISPALSPTKHAVRNHLHSPPGQTDTAWQTLQGYVYGAGISRAKIFPGFLGFVDEAISRGHKLFIVSHKTAFGHFDTLRIPLRQAALDFLQANGVTAKILLPEIFFCNTLQEKIDTISSLSCNYFVDDLEDVFAHADFPQETLKILFSKNIKMSSHVDRVCESWEKMASEIMRPMLTK